MAAARICVPPMSRPRTTMPFADNGGSDVTAAPVSGWKAAIRSARRRRKWRRKWRRRGIRLHGWSRLGRGVSAALDAFCGSPFGAGLLRKELVKGDVESGGNRHRQQPAQDAPRAEPHQDRQDRYARMAVDSPADDQRHDHLVFHLHDHEVDRQASDPIGTPHALSPTRTAKIVTTGWRWTALPMTSGMITWSSTCMTTR